MYEEYWGLKEKPFRNTPDPKYLYYSSQHEEALARLVYAVSEYLGCVVLSGVFGCGKTLLLNALLKKLPSGKYKIAFVSNPQLNPTGLLQAILYQLGIKNDIPKEKSEILALLDRTIENNYNDGKDTVVIVDEAHIIEDEKVFEELRLLLNWQKEDRFLITLILAGQPELFQKVANIKQLAQRVGIRAELGRFDFNDTANYINHRLKVAGREKPIFTEAAYSEIFNHSGGIPRRINSLCDLSLLSGFARKKEIVDDGIIRDTVGDLI